MEEFDIEDILQSLENAEDAIKRNKEILEQYIVEDDEDDEDEDE
jgi:hypothetical protein